MGGRGRDSRGWSVTAESGLASPHTVSRHNRSTLTEQHQLQSWSRSTSPLSSPWKTINSCNQAGHSFVCVVEKEKKDDLSDRVVTHILVLQHNSANVNSQSCQTHNTYKPPSRPHKHTHMFSLYVSPHLSVYSTSSNPSMASCNTSIEMQGCRVEGVQKRFQGWLGCRANSPNGPAIPRSYPRSYHRRQRRRRRRQRYSKRQQE